MLKFPPSAELSTFRASTCPHDPRNEALIVSRARSIVGLPFETNSTSVGNCIGRVQVRQKQSRAAAAIYLQRKRSAAHVPALALRTLGSDQSALLEQDLTCCLHVRMYVNTYVQVCMHACMHGCMHVCADEWMHACTHSQFVHPQNVLTHL